MNNWNIHEAVEYYKGQDAPQNQFALVELLKEVQEHNGGVLTDIAVEEIAALLNTKVTFLNAVIKRYPSLKPASAPHRLEVCGGKTAPPTVRQRCLNISGRLTAWKTEASA